MGHLTLPLFYQTVLDSLLSHLKLSIFNLKQLQPFKNQGAILLYAFQKTEQGVPMQLFLAQVPFAALSGFFNQYNKQIT